jgi:dsDNA-binding SOS-regulon protein
VVITTKKEESLISDLAETFDNLNRYKLKLNPTKCSFGVSAGQLLGFLVSARGIEANPEKNQAILTMGKPKKLHDVQKLAGRVAALSRFVARLGEKALPFYALMKKSDDKFEWTEEADIAFAQLKKVLSTPPVLVAPKEKEPLLLYIAATHQVVSTILVVKRSEKEKLMESSGQYISSARYYLQQSKGTRTTGNLHTVYSQQHKNYGNISRCTQL